MSRTFLKDSSVAFPSERHTCFRAPNPGMEDERDSKTGKRHTIKAIALKLRIKILKRGQPGAFRRFSI